MRSLRLPRPTAVATVAFAAFAFAAAMVVQDSGPNQAAHFALVRSLASGSAEIDPRETIDASYVDGRYYAAKAPGLAMFTVPWYGTLRAAGLQDESLASSAGYRHRVWELSLFGALLPMLALLALAYVAVERIAPDFGAAAAILLGAGTLLLPFATLFFDHVLSAALGFAAFVVMLVEREKRLGDWALAVAGLLAGLAIVVEFPLGVVAVVLGVLAAFASRPARRVASYAAGVVAGVVPLLVYNTLAFGSPTKLSYTNTLKEPVGGAPVVGANEKGLYGVGAPDPRAALSLLASEKGLLVVTPLAIAALAGLPLLWRAGRRAESAVCAAVPLLFLVYNAAYYLPFGGQSPGPRFLVPALPFLVLPLALALRARPLLVAGIGLASAAVMTLATVTHPLTGVEYGIGTWLDLLGDGKVVETVPGWLGAPSRPAAAAVVALLVLALAVAVARLPVRLDWRGEGVLLAGALGAWILLALVTPDLLPADEVHGTFAGTASVVLLLAAIGTGLAAALRAGPVALVPLAPAAVLAAPQLGERPRASLLVTIVVLAGASVFWARLWKTRTPRQRTYDGASHDVRVASPR